MIDSETARSPWIAVVQLDGTRAVLRNEVSSVWTYDGCTWLVYPDGRRVRVAEFVGYLRSDAEVIPFLRD